MPVSNEEIMKKLDKIELMISKLTVEEEKAFEEVEVDKNKQFTDVEEWKTHVWENCPYKEEKVVGEEIDFNCKKTDKPCRFEGCPENVKS